MYAHVIDIRPGERKAVISTFLTLFGILAGHTILETARDAYFLRHLPVEHLPWVYLGIAALAWAAIWLQRGNPGRKGLVGWLWLSAGVTLGFYFLAEEPSTWLFYALYIWSGFFVSVSIGTFWLMLGRVFGMEQAKRLFGIIVAGSVLGAIAGAGIAAYLATHLAVREMLLAAALCFALTALGPLMVRNTGLHWSTRTADISTFRAIRVVLDHPYMNRMALMALVSTACFTLVDFIFKMEVAARVAPEDLATFFAVFYGLVNVVALAVQLLVTAPALQVLGVQRTLWILPLLLVAGSGFVVLGLGLTAAMALKGAEGSLKHTLHRTANEVLYVPMSDSLRPYAKRFIDVFGQRLSQAAGSLLILGVTSLGGGVVVLSGLVVLLGVGWMGVARSLRPHYLELFRQTLRGGATATRVVMPRIDLEALEALMLALNSADDDEVVTALDLLAGGGRAQLIPALILHHPSSRIVLRALKIFRDADREDYQPLLGRLLEHAEAEVRAAAIRLEPSDARVRQAIHDPQPLVRGTALVVLLGRGDDLGEEAQTLITALVKEGDAQARIALAQAIEHRPTFKRECESILLSLAGHPEPPVMAAAARAMAVFPRKSFVHPLIAMLTFREPRKPARVALAALGVECVEALGEALVDESVEFGIRVNIPDILTLWPSEDVARRLARQLLVERSGMVRFKILRALHRMGQIEPSLLFSHELLSESMNRTLRSAYVLLDWHWTLKERGEADPTRSTAGHELLKTLIRDKFDHAIDRLFRHLNILDRKEDFARIQRGLRSTNEAHVASSLELLENLLASPLRESVIGLVKAIHTEMNRGEYLSIHAPNYARCEGTYASVLSTILSCDSDSLRAVCAYHIGELELGAFTHQLQNLKFAPGSSSEDVVTHALEKITQAAPEAPHAS